MRSELDQLRLPRDYVLLQETASGSSLGFFGEHPKVQRQYRAPRPIKPTCEEIEEAARAFATLTREPSTQVHGERVVCSLGFRRRSFGGGIVARSAPSAERMERLGHEGEPFVRVDVQLTD